MKGEGRLWKAVGMAAIDEDAALWTGVCGDKGGVGGDEEGGALAVEGHGAVDCQSVDGAGCNNDAGDG